MIGLLLAVDIVLTIAALVVRDQTRFKLSRLRTELLALRSEEQRLGEEGEELQQMIAQVGEAVLRADHRRKEMKAVCQELISLLESLGVDSERVRRLGGTSCLEQNNS